MNFTDLLVLILLSSFVLLVADLVRPTFSPFLFGDDIGRLKSSSVWFGLGVFSFVLLGIFGVPGNENSTGSTENKVKLPDYEIVEIKDMGYTDVERYEYWVHVKDVPTKESLKKLGKKIIKTAKNDRKFNALAVQFIPHNHLSGSPSRIIYAPGGDWSKAGDVTTGDYSTMEYKHERLSEFVDLKKTTSKSETKFGLSELERQNIYYEIGKAEKKARVEAEEKYPTDLNCVSVKTQEENQEKNLELERKLTDKYRNEVFEKYGISDTVATKIVTEGVNKKWKTAPVKEQDC